MRRDEEKIFCTNTFDIIKYEVIIKTIKFQAYSGFYESLLKHLFNSNEIVGPLQKQMIPNLLHQIVEQLLVRRPKNYQ